MLLKIFIVDDLGAKGEGVLSIIISNWSGFTTGVASSSHECAHVVVVVVGLVVGQALRA
jgi:hypothetical protein